MVKEPTKKELELAARANELDDAAALPTVIGGGFLGQAVGFLLRHVSRGILTAGLALFIAFHAWTGFNESLLSRAELQEKRAKTGLSQAEAAALNSKTGEITTAQKTVEADLQKTRADASTAQAEADAFTHSVDGVSARLRQLRAELEQKQADAVSARADADAALQKIDGIPLAVAQKRAEVGAAEADAQRKIASIKLAIQTFYDYR